MRALTAVLLCAMAVGAAPYQASADDGRWVTFRTVQKPLYGAVADQMDTTSIRAEGSYRTFWSRAWLVGRKQPLVFSRNENLIFLSEKFAADCAGHRFGARALESNDPAARKTALAAMRWQSLDTVPAVAKSVCGAK